MKLKIRLSLLIIGIMTVVVAGISFLLLNQATEVVKKLSLDTVRRLAEQRAEYWKGRENANIRMLGTVAGVMADYKSIPAAERRARYEDILRSTLIDNTNVITIYSVWKPNALDGMDSQYIGRVGSTPTGQFAVAI